MGSKMARPDSKQWWFEHIEEWEKSPLPQRQYCKQHNISYSRFVKYRAVYSKESYERSFLDSDFAPISIVEDEPETQQNIIDTNPKPDIVITLPKDIKISVPYQFDSDHLSSLVKVLVDI